ncbi:hypothetical protein HDV00_005612 [Rhizophlyctis rosea]|nr:hypothetical protein HDV00_005612 [Rhizophlyctis rosea]
MTEVDSRQRSAAVGFLRLRGAERRVGNDQDTSPPNPSPIIERRPESPYKTDTDQPNSAEDSNPRSNALGFLRRWTERRTDPDSTDKPGPDRSAKTPSPQPQNITSPLSPPAERPKSPLSHQPPQKRRSFSGKPLQIPLPARPNLHHPTIPRHIRNTSTLDDGTMPITPSLEMSPDDAPSFEDRVLEDTDEAYDKLWSPLSPNSSLAVPRATSQPTSPTRTTTEESLATITSPRITAPEGYKGLVTLERISVLLRRKEEEVRLEKEAEEMNLTTLERKLWMVEEENRRRALGLVGGDGVSDRGGAGRGGGGGLIGDPGSVRKEAVQFLALRRRAASASRVEGVVARERVLAESAEREGDPGSPTAAGVGMMMSTSLGEVSSMGDRARWGGEDDDDDDEDEGDVGVVGMGKSERVGGGGRDERVSRDRSNRMSGISLLSTGSGSAKLASLASWGSAGSAAGSKKGLSDVPEEGEGSRRRGSDSSVAREQQPFRRAKAEIIAGRPSGSRSRSPALLSPPASPTTASRYHQPLSPTAPPSVPVRAKGRRAVSPNRSLETPPASSGSSRSGSGSRSRGVGSGRRTPSDEEEGGRRDMDRGRTRDLGVDGGLESSRSPGGRRAEVVRIEDAGGRRGAGGAAGPGRRRAETMPTNMRGKDDELRVGEGSSPPPREAPPVDEAVRREFDGDDVYPEDQTLSSSDHRHLFLFNDVLVIAKLIQENKADPLGSYFQVKNILALRHAQLVIKDERTAVVDQTTHPVWQAAVRRFSSNPIRAVAYLIAKRGIPCTPEAIAHFLHVTPNLPRKQVGKFLGIPEHRDILHAYLGVFDFGRLRVDESLRVFLGGFRMPNDVGVVESVIEVFARRWYACNVEGVVGTGGAGGGKGTKGQGGREGGGAVTGGGTTPTGELSVDVIVKLVKAIMMLNAEMHHPFFSTASASASGSGGGTSGEGTNATPVVTAREFVDRFRASVRADRVAAGSGVYSSGVPTEMLMEIYGDVRKEKLEMAESDGDGVGKMEVLVEMENGGGGEKGGERGSPQPPSVVPFPTRLTLKHSSPVVTVTIPEPDPDFRILLHGSDLTCDPPVLRFERTNIATFRVKGTGLGRKLLMFIRQGPRGRCYSPIRTRAITVEPAFLRHSFRVDCWVQEEVGFLAGFAGERRGLEGVSGVGGGGVMGGGGGGGVGAGGGGGGKKKYLFAVADGGLKREWVDAFWRAGMVPRGWELEGNAAVNGIASNGTGAGYDPTASIGSPPRYAAPPSTYSSSSNTMPTRGRNGGGGRQPVPSTTSTSSTSSSSDASISGEVAIRVLKDYILPPDGEPIEARELVGTVLKNAMMPVALGFLRSRLG